MEIVFWLGVVPLVGLIVVIWAWTKVVQKLTPLVQLDLPIESLSPNKQTLRVLLFPDHDLTPEERAEQLAEGRHREIVRAIHSSRR